MGTTSYLLPRQHGAWSVLGASFIIGVLAGVGRAGSVGPAIAIFALAVIAVFFARHSASVFLKSGRGPGFVFLWTFIAIISAVFLVFHYNLKLMLPLGGIIFVVFVISLLLERRKLDRGVAGEILNMCGLSIVAPFAAYTTTGILNLESAGLFALCALFFSGSVFHVRYIAGRREMGSSYSVVYHLAAIAMASLLVGADVLPEFAALALVPAAIRAIVPIMRGNGSEKASLKRIGLLELAHTAMFVGMVVVIFNWE